MDEKTLQVKQFVEDKGWSFIEGLYETQQSKFKISCPEGHIHLKNWRRLKRGFGCVKCNGASQRKQLQEVIDLMQGEGFVYLDGDYKNKYSKLLWENPQGEKVWLSWHSINAGYRSSPMQPNEYSEIQRKAEEIGHQLLSPKYKNARTEMKWKCSEGHTYKRTYNTWSQREQKCPICAKPRKEGKEVEKAIEEMGYKLRSNYINCHTFIDVEYNDQVYKTTWNRLRSGMRPENNLSLLDFKRVKKFVEDSGYILLSNDYNDYRQKLSLECPEGHQYEASWNTFQQGRRCPTCGKQKTSGYSISKAEKEIQDFLTENDVNYSYNDYSLLGNREVDIKIEDHKLAIEYCGLYWHSHQNLMRKGKTVSETQNYHRSKRVELNELGYNLLTIYSNEWTKKNDIVKSIILARVGKVKHYYARKGKCKEISYRVGYDFIEENHLMGGTSCRHVGLFIEAKMVAVLGYKLINETLKIERFAGSTYTRTIGAFSKLLKHAIKETKPKKVESFVDFRYGDGGSYEKMGFTKVGETLGWKWTNNFDTFNRLYCRANMDDRRLTQAEHAEEMKLNKIYDCGQAKYQLVLG